VTESLLLYGHAGRLPLADESVDLVVTSPPYWQLRAYATGHPGELDGLAGDLELGEVGG
jgi:DNA modification methylase